MSRKSVDADSLHAEWMRDQTYRRSYNDLGTAMIKARARAGLTQAELARRMQTRQAVIARLESGRVKPSTRTLERIARATGHKLKTSFEPARDP